MAEIKAGLDAILSTIGDDARGVAVGKNIYQSVGEDTTSAEVRMARMEMRLASLERSQDRVSWAILLLAAALVIQTIWIIQSQNTALAGISSQMATINRHVVRLEAMWAADRGEGYYPGEPLP